MDDDYRVTSCAAPPGRSPHRLTDRRGKEVTPVNEFLDTTALRGLSAETLRTYAFALLSAWKWLVKASHSIETLTETHLADFLRYLQAESAERKPPAPRSLNLRLVVLRSLYRFHTGLDLPRGRKAPLEALPLFQMPTRIGFRATRRVGRPGLRVKVPRRLIVPLDRSDVARLFESFHSARDLAIASLMLFCGLRSCEVLALELRDVHLLAEEIRVTGKGNRERSIPLAPYVRRALAAYIERERPRSTSTALFLNLKGTARGRPMTPSGLRGLFRFHRRRSGVEAANPHRLRHTFATDMVREGMSLPVLKRLLGHSHIEMTLRYINLSAEDVRAEMERALGRLSAGAPDGLPLPRNP